MHLRSAQTFLALAFAALPAACTLDGTGEDLSSDTMESDAPATLQLERVSPELGLLGTFSKGKDAISFEAVRRVVINREGDGPAQEVDVRFLDQDGRTFKLRVAGHGLIDPAWQEDLDREYAAEEAGKLDHEGRARAFALLEEAAATLASRTIPGMEAEREGVIAAAMADRQLDDVPMLDDLSLAPSDPEYSANTPSLLDAVRSDTSYQTLGSTSNWAAGNHKFNTTEADHAGTCSGGEKYVHYAEVRYVNDELLWSVNFEHSATLLRSICDTCGTVVLEVEHCNHGRCALESGMKTNCHGMWGNRDAAILGQRGCKTDYVAMEGFSGHVCNDDSVLQYTEVRTNTPYDANGGTCSNRDLRKWAPDCTDGYPYALRINKLMSSTAWSNWEHIEPATVGTKHFLVRHMPRRTATSDTIEVLEMAGAVPGPRADVVTDASSSVSWKVVKPIETAHGTYLLTFQYGRLAVRRILQDGTLTAPSYNGPMPGPSGSTQWNWDTIDSYEQGGKTFVVFHDRVRVSSPFPNGIGALAIYELGANGSLTATSFSLQDPDLLMHVFTTSAGSFLMQNGSNFLEIARLTNTGMVGSRVAGYAYGGPGKAWDEIETFDNDEGTFVTFYKRGGQSCSYGGSTPCMQSGELTTYRIYRDGRIGYRFGSFDWPTVHGELELETTNIGSYPYLYAFQPEQGQFEVYRLNRR